MRSQLFSHAQSFLSIAPILVRSRGLACERQSSVRSNRCFPLDGLEHQIRVDYRMGGSGMVSPPTVRARDTSGHGVSAQHL